MGQLREPVHAVDKAAHAASDKWQQNKAGIDGQPDERRMPDLSDRFRRLVSILSDACKNTGILHFAQDLISAGDVAGKRERWDQHAKRSQDRKPSRIPSLGTQPEMQADAGVHPKRYHGGKLQIDQPWRDDPLVGENRMIVTYSAEESIGNLCADNVQ